MSMKIGPRPVILDGDDAQRAVFRGLGMMINFSNSIRLRIIHADGRTTEFNSDILEISAMSGDDASDSKEKKREREYDYPE